MLFMTAYLKLFCLLRCYSLPKNRLSIRFTMIYFTPKCGARSSVGFRYKIVNILSLFRTINIRLQDRYYLQALFIMGSTQQCFLFMKSRVIMCCGLEEYLPKKGRRKLLLPPKKLEL